MIKSYWTKIECADESGVKALYKCVCGKEKMVNINNVNRLKSKSCGCNGKAKVPKEVSRTFTLMKYRCETKTSSDYPMWGGKGIKVEYKDVQEFYKDVGDKPSKKHSIDRIDGTKSYCVGNCRWATSEEQMNNVSTNVNIRYNGVTKSITRWARHLKINNTTLRYRLSKMSVEEAFSKKLDESKSIGGVASGIARKIKKDMG